MTKLRSKLPALAAILLGIAALVFWLSTGRVAPGSVPDPQAKPPRESATTVTQESAKVKAKPAGVTAEPNPLADQLNAADGTIRRDLEVLNNLFVNFQTNFPRTGNPVGENSEITAALTGANPLGFAFVPKSHPAINAAGELRDRWGTPFRFHQRSGTQMEIRSAGPDRKFGTADDVEFAPWAK